MSVDVLKATITHSVGVASSLFGRSSTKHEACGVIASITQSVGLNCRFIAENVVARMAQKWALFAHLLDISNSIFHRFGEQNPTYFIQYKNCNSLSKCTKFLQEYTTKYYPNDPVYKELFRCLNSVRLHGNKLVHGQSLWYVAELDLVEILKPMAQMLYLADDLGFFK